MHMVSFPLINVSLRIEKSVILMIFLEYFVDITQLMKVEEKDNMGEMSEYWRDVKPYYKQKHDNRVAQTPSRIEYTKRAFDKHKIPYELKNGMTGQFNVVIEKGKTVVYYCSTGTVMINNKVKNGRGIGYAISLCKKLMKEVIVDETYS